MQICHRVAKKNQMMIESPSNRHALEEAWLAPWAAHSAESRGREFAEKGSSRRVAFQRDRDRIVNAKSFRRLEYKTQVFVNGTADHYRTRLTHTIEMTSVGRTLARALRVNEDLTAAICLAHDIGHSPFGHAGERALDELMQEHGGFDHNRQSLRWVELLEEEYPGFNGLNLSWEVRAGLRKHESKIPGLELAGFPIGPFQMVEAQIADIADDITYQAHDVQDGLEASLLNPEQLQDLELWRRAMWRVKEEYPDYHGRRLVPAAVRKLVTLQVEDVLRYAADQLAEDTPENSCAVMHRSARLVDFSLEMKAMIQPLRDMLFKRMYWHPAVEAANNEAVDMMRKLFMHYIENPLHMGAKALARMEREGLWRTACDYVSGCTDRYALEECRRHGLA